MTADPVPNPAPPTQPSPARRAVRWGAVILIGLAAGLTIDLARQAFTADRVNWQPLAAIIQPVAHTAPTTAEPPKLVSFSADWCGPCREMVVGVFSKRDIADYIHANTLPYRVDLTHPDTAQSRLGEHYRVSMLPTVLLIDASGREISRLDHVVDAEQFRRWLDRGLTKSTENSQAHAIEPVDVLMR